MNVEDTKKTCSEFFGVALGSSGEWRERGEGMEVTENPVPTIRWGQGMGGGDVVTVRPFLGEEEGEEGEVADFLVGK